MNYLWTIEYLSKLTRNSEPKVKAWACERLKTLYGKAGIPALEGLLKERDEDVLREALDYLLEFPSPQFAHLVLEIYKREKGHIAGRAAMVLAKIGDERIFEAFSEKKMDVDIQGFEELLSGYEAMGELKTDKAVVLLEEAVEAAGDKTEPVSLKSMMAHILHSGKGLDFVLDYYLMRYKDSGSAIISALLDYCQFWHSEEELSGGKKRLFKKGLPPVVENAVSMLKANAEGKIGRELERLFKKEDYCGVITTACEYADSLVKEAAEHVGEKAFSEWKSKDSQPRMNYTLITALNNLPSPSKEAGKGLAIVAIASLAALEDMKYLIGLSVNAGIKALYTFLEDRGDTVDDNWIEGILLNLQERDTLIEETIRIIKWKPYSIGTRRGVRLLGLIGDERAIPCLIEIIGAKNKDFEDRAIDEAITALVRFGEQILPALEKLMDGSDRSAVNEAFFILKDIPVKKTEELLLRNWDRFMGINRELFTMALEGVASKEFIPLLRKEIREGELVEAEVFHLLCLIHGVKDPLLPQIEEELKRAEEEVKKAFAGFKEGDLLPIIEAPLHLELKCKNCGRAYRYKVNEVVIDPEKPGSEPEITDTVVCKNCGSVNNYELTDKGSTNIAIRASMMVGLLKEGRIEDPLALPVKFMKMRFMGNKPMSSFKEAMEEYKKALGINPDDPALRIGYGNMLKRQGMLSEAESQFSEAARLEPNAVEAYTQLGEIAEKRGDVHAAHDFYAKALERMPNARYFRTQDVDGFKEMVVDKHHYLREQAKAGSGATLIEGVIKVEPQRKKAGRNDPCPCGSGKKYKKCCLAKDEAAIHKTATTPVEKSLTDRLIAFSFRERFKKDFESAYLLYFDRPFRKPVVMDEEKEMEFESFLEWFIHDSLLKSGKTIVEEFYQEEFRRLSEEEKEVLEAEMVSYLSVYEVTAVTPEEGIALSDLFTGEGFEVRDVKGSRLLIKWDIVITRAIRQKTVNKLSGIVTLLPRDDKELFMATLSAKWEEFRKETGKIEWKAFMKTRGHLLSQIHNERTASRPVPFTEERHHIVDSRAEYDVLDIQGIRRFLSNEFDFVLDDEKEGKELQYTWLKRGKSEIWGEAALPKLEGIRPIVIQSQFISPGGDVRFTTLGSIRATSKGLTLECLSKERLERGKARLKEVLGDIVRHREDSFKAFETPGGKRERRAENTGPGMDNETKLSLMSKYYSKYIEEWINSPIPALGGLSPLESCWTEAGRSKVEELLKDMENSEERKRKDGQPYMDMNKIRERLKLL